MTTEQKFERLRKSYAKFMADASDFMKQMNQQAEPLKGGDKSRQRVTMIQDVVCSFYSVSPTVMITPARPQHYVRPRQVAMSIARELTRYSLEQIGLSFGGRDHGTVINACESIKDRLESEPGFKAEYAVLVATCRDRLNNIETPLFALPMAKPGKTA